MNPIRYQPCYVTSDDKPHFTVQSAQRHEMESLLRHYCGEAVLAGVESVVIEKMAEGVIAQAASVRAILNMKERQRVRAAKPSSRGVKRKNASASDLGKQLPLPAKETAGTPPQSQKDAA